MAYGWESYVGFLSFVFYFFFFFLKKKKKVDDVVKSTAKAYGSWLSTEEKKK